MKIILFQPQIPQNTGNIVRTCAVTGSELLMVHPLGFSTTDRWLKRAGLDYWEGVPVSFLEDQAHLEQYLEQQTVPFFFFSSHATEIYTSASYTNDSILIFGSETKGLPPSFYERWPEKFVKIPMIQGVRCLNLATSAGIALYEAWRQSGFSGIPSKL